MKLKNEILEILKKINNERLKATNEKDIEKKEEILDNALSETYKKALKILEQINKFELEGTH